MFTSKKEIHNPNTRQKLHPHIKKNNHEYVYRNLIYQGVCWNMIIDNIEVNISIAKFIYILKKS